MSDARHLLPELSLRAPQRLPELSLHAPQQLAELTPPQQLPEPLLRAPDDGQHNLPQQSRDLQQPPQPTLHPAASPGFGSCHTRSAGSGVGEFPHMTQAAAWLAAASPRLGVGSSPTCGFTWVAACCKVLLAASAVAASCEAAGANMAGTNMGGCLLQGPNCGIGSRCFTWVAACCKVLIAATSAAASCEAAGANMAGTNMGGCLLQSPPCGNSSGCVLCGAGFSGNGSDWPSLWLHQ
eukprot:1160402-Pelagomonas_calceolata.AAC.4